MIESSLKALSVLDEVTKKIKRILSTDRNFDLLDTIGDDLKLIHEDLRVPSIQEIIDILQPGYKSKIIFKERFPKTPDEKGITPVIAFGVNPQYYFGHDVSWGMDNNFVLSLNKDYFFKTNPKFCYNPRTYVKFARFWEFVMEKERARKAILSKLEENYAKNACFVNGNFYTFSTLGGYTAFLVTPDDLRDGELYELVEEIKKFQNKYFDFFGYEWKKEWGETNEEKNTL